MTCESNPRVLPNNARSRSDAIGGLRRSGAVRAEAGESWTEPPGAHHQTSKNGGATEPASLLAIFVVDTNDTAELTTLERQ